MEELEVDQYIWSILQRLAGTEFEEVTIDSQANWKPVSKGLTPNPNVKVRLTMNRGSM